MVELLMHEMVVLLGHEMVVLLGHTMVLLLGQRMVVLLGQQMVVWLDLVSLSPHQTSYNLGEWLKQSKDLLQSWIHLQEVSKL